MTAFVVVSLEKLYSGHKISLLNISIIPVWICMFRSTSINTMICVSINQSICLSTVSSHPPIKGKGGIPILSPCHFISHPYQNWLLKAYNGYNIGSSQVRLEEAASMCVVKSIYSLSVFLSHHAGYIISVGGVIQDYPCIFSCHA